MIPQIANRRGKEMRKLLTIFVFLTLTASITGCETGGSGPKEKEIVMWLVGSETQAISVNEIGKEFYEKTGIKIRCEAVSWGEAHSKYLTAIAGDVTPDIGTMGLTWGGEFGSLGAMIDLREYFKDDVISIRRKIFPGIWHSVVYKGKVYGIPFDMTEHVLYYRKDMIKIPPKSWGELTALLGKLNAEGKSMLFDWGSLNWIGYSVYLWQAGGDYYNENLTECELDSPEAARGMEFFADLYNKYKVPRTSIPVEQGMRTGDFPLAISGNWKIVGLTLGAPEIEEKWSIAMLPKGPMGRATGFIGGRVMGIFAGSRMKKESWDFIKFLFKPESQKKLYDMAWENQDAYLPPNMESWDILPMKSGFKQVLKDQAFASKGPPPVLAWDVSARFVDQAIQKAVLTKEDIPGIMANATKQVNEELKKR